jgi:hypothetical protein
VGTNEFTAWPGVISTLMVWEAAKDGSKHDRSKRDDFPNRRNLVFATSRMKPSPENDLTIALFCYCFVSSG